MVELKVRKFGNSLGVVLPREVINRLHAQDGQTPYSVAIAEAEFDKLLLPRGNNILVRILPI